MVPLASTVWCIHAGLLQTMMHGAPWDTLGGATGRYWHILWDQRPLSQHTTVDNRMSAY